MIGDTMYANRTIAPGTVPVGALGAILIGAIPPLGVILLVAAFCIQRSYTKQRKAAFGRVSQRALERADREFILAAKSLR